MMTFEYFKDNYLLRNLDPELSVGSRNDLRYIANDYTYAAIVDINPDGLEPVEYLKFAKSDLLSADTRGAINALGNLKRAVHLLVESFLELLGLKKAFGRSSFPLKLEIIRKLEAFPTKLISSLNERRNLIEHEYKIIKTDDVEELFEIAEMFLRLCYPFLRRMVTGLHVGILNDPNDYSWQILPEKSLLLVLRCQKSNSIDSPIGKIYYNFSPKSADYQLIEKVDIKKTNSTKWEPFLNTMVYYTKRILLPEIVNYDPENKGRIKFYGCHPVFFTDEDIRSAYG